MILDNDTVEKEVKRLFREIPESSPLSKVWNLQVIRLLDSFETLVGWYCSDLPGSTLGFFLVNRVFAIKIPGKIMCADIKTIFDRICIKTIAYYEWERLF